MATKTESGAKVKARAGIMPRKRAFDSYPEIIWIPSRSLNSPEGGPIRRTNWRRRFWLPTMEASVDAPLRYHDLRHRHAAILIAQGEHVKVIADRLGHANRWSR